MNQVDLLILHGSPGTGKSSLTWAMSANLRDRGIKHAVIELDDLATIFPLSLQNIMYRNLASIWPNYLDLGDIKIVIPTYLQSHEELRLVKDSAPAQRIRVCELTAPETELNRRIKEREPDGVRQNRLLNYIKKYSNNRVDDKFIDIKISTLDRTFEELRIELLDWLGW